jgi:crossover junction endodeoxyribonuclease RuvC
VPSSTYRILGIDPGTRALGYAVIELDRQFHPRVVVEGTCCPPAREPISTRLHAIHVELCDLITCHAPDVVAVEDVFFSKNVRSALRLGECRGAVFVAAASADLEVYEYPPATVKQTVTGSGRASKTQVQSMVTRLLGLKSAPSSPDAADAIAVAFCHAQRLRAGPALAPTRKKRGQRDRGVSRKTLQGLVDRINQGSD